MKPTKQTVYLPVNGEQEKVVCNDYPDWMDTITGVIEEEGYFFTPEELNKYVQNVIKQALETAAKNAEITNKAKFSGDYNPVVDEESITNTFEETYNKFEV
jgi:hypothetical protein